MTLFVVIFLPLLVSLGFWQLDRGAEKRGLENDYLKQLTKLPIRVGGAAEMAPFQRVRLVGKYGQEVFLLDNQVVDGQPGYWVVQTFADDNQHLYLVNRGYLAAPKHRDQLPAVLTPAEKTTAVAVVWPYTGLIPVLDDDIWVEGWPKRVQRLDIQRMARITGSVPAELRLEPGQGSVFRAAPFAEVLNDSIHLGYAATWFGLAGVLLTGYIIFGRQRHHDRSAGQTGKDSRKQS